MPPVTFKPQENKQAILTLKQQEDAVLSLLDENGETRHEMYLIAYLTPFLQEIIQSISSDLWLVNSEYYSWLESTSGYRKNNCKPDLFCSHLSLVNLRPPFSNAPECSVNRLFGEFVNLGLRGSLSSIWDAKVRITDGQNINI